MDPYARHRGHKERCDIISGIWKFTVLGGEVARSEACKQKMMQCGKQQNRGLEVLGPAGEGEIKTLRDA